MQRNSEAVALLSSATTTETGAQHKVNGVDKTYSGWGSTSSGSGAAVILIEVRNSEDSPWITMGTISLTLSTTGDIDGFSSIVPWKYTRARVSSISGTGATISCEVGSVPQ